LQAAPLGPILDGSTSLPVSPRPRTLEGVMSLRAAAVAVAGAAIFLAVGCANPAPPTSAPQSTRQAAAKSSPDPSHGTRAPKAKPPKTKPPKTKLPKTKAPNHKRIPAFSAKVSAPLTARDLPHTWHHGCPVSPGELRAIRMPFIGFDHRAHNGTLIINAGVADKVIKVFSILYRARFPIRIMKPVDVFHGSDDRSTAADNTAGFNCRFAVAAGPPHWSMHAYGLAIDVDTIENPYIEPGQPIDPPASAAYANRSDIRPGMAYPGGVLVSAFSSIGWGWGGDWAGAVDYQHFSSNGH